MYEQLDGLLENSWIATDEFLKQRQEYWNSQSLDNHPIALLIAQAFKEENKATNI